MRYSLGWIQAKPLSVMTENSDSDHLVRGGGDTVGHSRGFRFRKLSPFLPLAICMTLTAAPGVAGVAEDVERVLSRENYQRELPVGPGNGSQAAPEALYEGQPGDDETNPAERERAENTRTFALNLGPVMKVLLWVLLGVGAILLAVYLYGVASRMRGRFGGAKADGAAESDPALQAEQAEEPRPLSEIERLAAGGAFGEAVHQLLLHSFGELRRRFPHARDSALTSREVLSRASLAPKARSGLTFIVAAVESGHFGGKRVDRKTYERCLDGYRDIAASDAS